jgi:hypothetical protein
VNAHRDVGGLLLDSGFRANERQARELNQNAPNVDALALVAEASGQHNNHGRTAAARP